MGICRAACGQRLLRRPFVLRPVSRDAVSTVSVTNVSVTRVCVPVVVIVVLVVRVSLCVPPVTATSPFRRVSQAVTSCASTKSFIGVKKKNLVHSHFLCLHAPTRNSQRLSITIVSRPADATGATSVRQVKDKPPNAEYESRYTSRREKTVRVPGPAAPHLQNACVARERVLSGHQN